MDKISYFLDVLSYFVIILVGILIIFDLLRYFIAKKLAGVIIGKTGFSKERFYMLLYGLFFILIGFLFLYIHRPSNTPISLSIIVESDFYIGIPFIIQYFTSKIIIGLNGISLPYVPFFIPKNQLAGYKMESNKIILMRRGRKDIEMKLRDKEASKVETMLKTMGTFSV